MADDSLFQVSLVTPERILLTGEATEVVLRTAEGDLAFLAGHTLLVGTIEPGVVRVTRADGSEDRAATHGGFVQFEHRAAPADGGEDAAPATGSRVTLLVGVAELAPEIDVPRAQAAREAAEARLAELGGAGRTPAEGEAPDVELAEAQADLRRAEVRLEAAEAGAASPA